MKPRIAFLLFFLVGLFLVSCTIEKRHYRNGFYWDRNKNLKREIIAVPVSDSAESRRHKQDTVFLPQKIENDESAIESLPVEVQKTIEREIPGRIKPVERKSSAVERQEQGPDDPKPEGHDRVNPWITALIIAAVILCLVFLLIDLFAIAGSAPYFFIVAPVVGILLFVLAMYLRKKYAERAAAGEKNDALRMSAHFHRFRIILYLFFIAALAMALGWLFAISGGFLFSGLGIIGVILGGGGIVLVQGAGAVLLILSLIYLFYWRKDPTGEKPPRDKHPPKGG